MVRKSLLAGLIAAVIMTGSSVCGIAVGAEKSKNDSSTGNKESTLIAQGMSQVEMVLDEKGEDYFLSYGRKFKVTPKTVIKDEAGLEITLKALSVPCKAEVIHYEEPSEGNICLVVSIKVKGKVTPIPE